MNALPGYLVVIDADGAEADGSRRDVSALTLEESLQVRAELERAMGPDCHVEFKPSRWKQALPMIAAAGYFAALLLNVPDVF